jgi:hypothetical protein
VVIARLRWVDQVARIDEIYMPSKLMYMQTERLRKVEDRERFGKMNWERLQGFLGMTWWATALNREE